jgi:predicted nucleic acid-binding protein
MATLIDTSILGRIANQADTFHVVAKAAVAELHRRGETLYITPQNLVEFRNFATRPTSVNGLGLAANAADQLLAVFEAAFPLLPETPAIYPAWKAIISTLGVIGKQVHDARLVAVCHAHAVTHLLSFNVVHFARMAGLAPGVVLVDPSTV